jgi:transcriptional regulator with XRE-family HTH domain
MENTLLRFCRESHRYSPQAIAHKLGIKTHVYFEIESGETLLTYKQAEKLGQLYNTSPHYFYNAAQQLDLLLTKNVIIKAAKWRISQLEERLKLIEQNQSINHPLQSKPKSQNHAYIHKPFNG